MERGQKTVNEAIQRIPLATLILDVVQGHDEKDLSCTTSNRGPRTCPNEEHIEQNEDTQVFSPGEYHAPCTVPSGARQSNVLAMRWEQVRLDRAEWRIPGEQFKSGEDQCIPLAPEALDVLTRRHPGATSSFVFPGRGGTGHLTRPGKWWTRLLQRCGFSEHLTMHDLRRTLGSWQAAGGASLLVIGKTLGHQDQRSTQVYSRLDLQPVRDSLTAAAAAIKEAAKGTES